MQRKPVVTEVRTPTDTWSGLGFSKSMPAEAVKELRNISRRSYKPYLSTSSGQVEICNEPAQHRRLSPVFQQMVLSSVFKDPLKYYVEASLDLFAISLSGEQREFEYSFIHALIASLWSARAVTSSCFLELSI